MTNTLHPEALDGRSLDISADKRQQLKALFPSVFTETRNAEGAVVDSIDFERLKAELGSFSDVFESRKERFGLDWPGKADCMKVIQQPSTGTLLPMRDESVNFDTSENLIIEGDNLEVLKLLQKSYYGKVKMIYIDPPYNTGNEYIYPDNFHEGLDSYLRYSGQVDTDGNKQSANSETSGRYHSNWLSMMYPRLFLARNLLREDGFIFVNIDDHEAHNLRSFMGEIFGHENFIANIVWQKKYTRSNDAKWFSDNHDHIMVFARNKENSKLNLLPRSSEQIAAYSNPDNHPKGPWKATPLHAKSGVSREAYTFKNGMQWAPPEGTFRRFSNDTMEEMDIGNEIWFGDNLLATPSRKSFLQEVKAGVTPVTIWPYDEVGHNHEANTELKELLGDGVFDNPKPTRLIKRILELTTKPSEHNLILDFFGGSGTTGDAVIRLNGMDGGNRSFILVQLPQPTTVKNYSQIAEITRARVKKSIEKQQDSSRKIGFRAFKLAASNFKVWSSDPAKVSDLGKSLQLFADHVTANRKAEDILYELLLKAGYPLTATIEKLTLAGKEVFSISDGALLICLDRRLTLEVIDAMVARTPAMILCLDDGFRGNDQLKVNAVQTVKSRNQNDETDIVFRVV